VSIGNDVVDLGDPAIAAHHRRARFVARVCGADERRRLAVAADPRRLLWSLFAAKEAAYKVWVRRAPLVLAHRRFEVAADLASVGHGDATLALRVDGDARHVHAVAWDGDAPGLSGVAEIAAGVDAGVAARWLLCAAVAPHLGCAAHQLRVDRPPLPGGWTGAGPPRLLRGAAVVGVDVSLSHDGAFVAYATAPMLSARR
jgi:phosphopantetheinyl transferase (holo-ACP synthase)